jgi:hypothetical protein
MPELLELAHVVGQAEVGEDAGVHLRVQRLDPPVEALGEAGELVDGVTATPASRSRAAVEPVDTTSTPASASPRPSSSSPVLS